MHKVLNYANKESRINFIFIPLRKKVNYKD
jgi:hypothetical protein